MLPAQADDGPAAVLVSGPVARRGLPFLPPNIIEYQRAIYETDSGQVEVFYSEDAVFRPEGWSDTSCGGRELALVSAAAPRVLYHTWDGGRHAFFRFSADAASQQIPPTATAAKPDECQFITTFLERFAFFLRTTSPAALAPFPAVLPSP
jgi:hypothetical protein